MTTKPFKFHDKSYVLQKIRRILRTDPVLTVHQLEHRLDFSPIEWLIKPTARDWWDLLVKEGFACTELRLKISVGARVKTSEQFVCSSERISHFSDWNLRQLAGLAALRYGLGIRPDNWQLRALERTNQSNDPIPDAMIHLARATNPQIAQGDSVKIQGLRLTPKAKPEAVIAVEWDSGSATRDKISHKILNYSQVATSQIWAVPTQHRAETINQLLQASLSPAASMVVTVDWRTAKLIRLMLPYRGGDLDSILSRVVSIAAPWKVHLSAA